MSIRTIIRGRIADGPHVAETGVGVPVVTFVVGDKQIGLHRGREYEMDDMEACEVICRGSWSSDLISALQDGDPVIVIGDLKVSVPLNNGDNAGLVLVTIEAETVGRDLAAARLPSSAS